MQNKAVITQNKRLIGILLAATFLLLVPLVGNIVSNEWVWDLFNFAVAGFLLFGIGLLYELAARKGGNTSYRAAAAVALVAALLLIWINLAVGLIGNENNPANLMYFGVVAIGFIGAGIARFQPRGMAYALFATALAQALVPVIAIIIWRPPVTMGMVKVLVLNTFFVMLFAGSAFLFRHASAMSSTKGRES